MYITRSILHTCVLFNDFTKKLYIKFAYTFTIFYIFSRIMHVFCISIHFDLL